jgi:hypothetical protein
MHARELIELAAVTAIHAPVLVRGATVIPEKSIESYWTASKKRLDRWGRILRQLTKENAETGCLNSLLVRGVLEEIFTGEILTRVWTATMCAYDRQRGTDLVEPIVRSVLIGHMEARHRVLLLLVHAAGLDVDEAIRLNQLRARTERWTDFLVGHLSGLYDIGEFAHDPDRAKDFCDDLTEQSRERGGRHVWPLALASLRAAFQKTLVPHSPNADLNAEIATSVIACFPPEVFDSTGLLQSTWISRMSNTTTEAEGRIEALLASSARPSHPTVNRCDSRVSFHRHRRFD